MKVHPMGAELFNVDRQPDRPMTQLIVAIRNFAKAPKDLLKVSHHQSRTREKSG
jgi:hypothetical protein